MGSHIKANSAWSEGTFCGQSTDNKRPRALNISSLQWISIISSFYFAPWNSHKCKLQLALSSSDYINLFLGQIPCGGSWENTVFSFCFFFASCHFELAQLVNGFCLEVKKKKKFGKISEKCHIYRWKTFFSQSDFNYTWLENHLLMSRRLDLLEFFCSLDTFYFFLEHDWKASNHVICLLTSKIKLKFLTNTL